MIKKITGNAVVVRDTVDETFWFSDGNAVQFKGTISLFTEYPPAVDRSKLLPLLKRICELSDEDAKDLISIPDTNSQLAMNYEDAQLASLSEPVEEKPASELVSELVTEEIPELDSKFEQALFEPVEKEDLPPVPDTKSEKLAADKAKTKEQQLASLTEKVTKFADNNKSEATNKNKIAVDATPAGIRLSIQDLQFKPNSSELLSGEASRLDQIAEVLKSVPEAQLLVEGHTASTGNINGEKQLSMERAQSIAKALAQRGVDSGRFICKGFGGTKPVADNSTAAGKARNRRVEITILD